MIRDAKLAYTTKTLCSGKTKDLVAFKREIFSYRFKEEPDYDGLRRMLVELRDEVESSVQESVSHPEVSELQHGDSFVNLESCQKEHNKLNRKISEQASTRDTLLEETDNGEAFE